jgi:hypothetical protein
MVMFFAQIFKLCHISRLAPLPVILNGCRQRIRTPYISRLLGGFLFFPPVFSYAETWAILSSSTLVGTKCGLLVTPILYLRSSTHFGSALCAFQLSTQEHWACRTHGNPEHPGSLGLDQNLLGFVFSQSHVLLIVPCTIVLCLHF